MRKCDNCGNVIPFGSDHIEVRIYGYKFEDLDFCSPKCFEEFFSKTRWKLIQNKRLLKNEKEV